VATRQRASRTSPGRECLGMEEGETLRRDCLVHASGRGPIGSIGSKLRKICFTITTFYSATPSESRENQSSRTVAYSGTLCSNHTDRSIDCSTTEHQHRPIFRFIISSREDTEPSTSHHQRAPSSNTCLYWVTFWPDGKLI